MVVFILGAFVLIACQAVTQTLKNYAVDGQPTSSITPSFTYPAETIFPTPPAAISSETPTSIPEKPCKVIFHPDNGLYVGDQVSIEVLAPKNKHLNDNLVQISVLSPVSVTLPTAKISPFGLGERYEANLTWAWDTRGLSPGDYTLNFSVQPYGKVWTETVSLQPAEDLPVNEIGAHWTTEESDCCLVYYITNTASARDIGKLLDLLDEQAEIVSRQMQAEFSMPVTVAFIPRVLGHGGFTASEISVSYLDRNYTGDAIAMILRHEMVHLMDNQLGGNLRPTMLVEGLAVYISGGHFKPEPLLSRAAALLDHELYIPLSQLIDDFYKTQHETGYLEAGALVQFMVEKYGWHDFSSFYRDIHPAPNEGKQSAAIDIALQKHFKLSLDDLEQEFITTLRSQKAPPDSIVEIQRTVAYYDTVRRYQQMLDPSAYFLNAWILNGKEMRQRGIVADYMRHSNDLINLVLETMLQDAGENLHNSDYAKADQLISSVKWALDAVERGEADPFSVSRQVKDVYTVIQIITRMGFETQRVQWNEDRIQVWASQSGMLLQEFAFLPEGSTWVLAAE